MELSHRLIFTKWVVVILIAGSWISWIAANFAIRTGHRWALYWIYGASFGAIALWSLSRIVRLLLPENENPKV